MAAGDHLRVTRGTETDHAIDVGDRTVIRWRAGAGVERVERAAFAPGDATVEVVVHRERIYRPALVVARAFSRFAESAYRAMFASPAQFAVWCKCAQLPAVTAVEAPATARKARPAPKAAVSKKASLRPAPRKAAAPVARSKAKPAAKARPVAKKAASKAMPKARPVQKAPKKGRTAPRKGAKKARRR